MRTTVTIDEDLVARLRSRARERQVPFKRVLNETLRSGLAAGKPQAKPFRVQSKPMGFRADLNLDKALALADELEDRELLRKQTLGR